MTQFPVSSLGISLVEMEQDGDITTKLLAEVGQLCLIFTSGWHQIERAGVEAWPT
jgi:hypothetical protein